VNTTRWQSGNQPAQAWRVKPRPSVRGVPAPVGNATIRGGPKRGMVSTHRPSGEIVIARPSPSRTGGAPWSSIEPVVAPIHGLSDIQRIVESFADPHNSGILFLPDVTTNALRNEIIALVARHHVPSVFTERAFVLHGGLASYGSDRTDIFRRAASYVDRVLRGEKPGDLPYQQPTKYELLINLAQHYYGHKRRDEVVRVLENLKSHAKEYPQAFEQVGGFYFRLGDGAEAMRQYEEGIKANPAKKAFYQKLIIEVLTAQGKKEDAKRVNDAILAADLNVIEQLKKK
jgi:hypothetical protein